MAPGDGDTVQLDLDGHPVAVSSPAKVYFPDLGATKLDLVGYYRDVGGAMLGAAGGRPTMLQRFPDGAAGKSFFQKRVPAGAPDWLQTVVVATPNGTTSRALVLADLAHVVWAVNLGCLGFHLWAVRAARPEVADELRIDLDPQPGVGFDEARRAAGAVRDFLDEVGLRGFLKTSGSRGLHVYLPLLPRWTPTEVRSAAVAVAREMERRRPDLCTAAWWKEERGARVFVDFNQNAPHKTVFGPWSVRARPGGQVSTPIGWDHLDTVDPDALTIATVPDRLRRLGDPWEGMAEAAQSLDPLLALAERDRAAGLHDAPWPPEYPKGADEPTRVAPSRARRGR
ncbi:MAG TPA: non-homologous end-joining DNA ligase [Acidimicrobiales bacterium]|nr:non-homologous end-joining DNA ligase [Acidimicrobiales bacterium]